MSVALQELVRGKNAARSAVVSGGMIVHAVSTFVVVTLLPTIVREIGGLRFFAWSTTLYVIASLLGGAVCARVLARLGPRATYRIALSAFAAGSVICALAPSMPVLLAGRFCQGLGAGILSAMSFTMVRLLFPEPLWQRALGAVSAAWGVAMLVGPALGGVFAQYTGWRVGFWVLFAFSSGMIGLVEMALPRDLPPVKAPASRLAVGNLALLACSVLAISAGSMATDTRVNTLGLAFAAAGIAWFVHREAVGPLRLMPRRSCDPSTPLGSAYAGLMCLLIGVTAEIFVPLFLQRLHGMTPLHAGYLSALMVAGWTTGSLVSGGALGGRARLAMAVGPFSSAIGLFGLCLLMPRPSGPSLGFDAAIPIMGCCLVMMGMGIGMSWPHLGGRVFSSAPEGEKELAASSMTVVIMVSNAFGSAMGGMITNVAGLTSPGGVLGASSAAGWLFGLYVAAPLTAALVIRRFRQMPREVAA